jgi:hypothetical protein
MSTGASTHRFLPGMARSLRRAAPCFVPRGHVGSFLKDGQILQSGTSVVCEFRQVSAPGFPSFREWEIARENPASIGIPRHCCHLCNLGAQAVSHPVRQPTLVASYSGHVDRLLPVEDDRPIRRGLRPKRVRDPPQRQGQFDLRFEWRAAPRFERVGGVGACCAGRRQSCRWRPAEADSPPGRRLPLSTGQKTFSERVSRSASAALLSLAKHQT